VEWLATATPTLSKADRHIKAKLVASIEFIRLAGEGHLRDQQARRHWTCRELTALASERSLRAKS
jgi:hypothetical protein